MAKCDGSDDGSDVRSSFDSDSTGPELPDRIS